MEGDNNPTGLRFPPALLLEVGIKARLSDMGSHKALNSCQNLAGSLSKNACLGRGRVNSLTLRISSLEEKRKKTSDEASLHSH